MKEFKSPEIRVYSLSHQSANLTTERAKIYNNVRRKDQAVTLVHVDLSHIKDIYRKCKNALDIASFMKVFLRFVPQCYVRLQY